MGIWDKIFGKKKTKPRIYGVTLTQEEVAEQIKQSWWDLFVSNMPRPVVIDTKNNPKDTPEIFKEGTPRGFSIDPETWITYFNTDDMPDFQTKKEAQDYARSIGQHETAHFTIIPGSKRNDVRLVDAALKGFTPQRRENIEQAAATAHLVTNIVGDWNNDTLLGVDNYGRENFSDLTRRRMRATIEDVAQKTKDYSPLWKVLIGVYEGLFNEDLGLSKYAQLSSNEKTIVEKCAEIMRKDIRDRETWPEKTRQVASLLENIIFNSCQNQGKEGKNKSKGQGQGGLSLPEDVEKQMGPRADGNQMKSYQDGKGEKSTKDEEGEGKGPNIDGEVLDEIYRLNKQDPGAFAGLLGAFSPSTGDDAIRLMNRMRSRDYLIKITETRDTGNYGGPSSYKSWNVGDPFIGRGGLEVVPSMMSTGIMIPGLTTIKRERQVVKNPGRIKQIADMFFIIDSSGSLNWNPRAPNEEDRGGFDKVIITTEAAALYALDKGARVAVLNHSGIDDRTRKNMVVYQPFTTDLDKIEKAINYYFGDGTVFPVEQVEELWKANKNRVVSCVISDFELGNPDETVRLFKKYTNKDNPLYMFDIGGRNALGRDTEGHEGLIRYPVKILEDLREAVIGRVREEYSR